MMLDKILDLTAPSAVAGTTAAVTSSIIKSSVIPNRRTLAIAALLSLGVGVSLGYLLGKKMNENNSQPHEQSEVVVVKTGPSSGTSASKSPSPQTRPSFSGIVIV